MRHAQYSCGATIVKSDGTVQKTRLNALNVAQIKRINYFCLNAVN